MTDAPTPTSPLLSADSVSPPDPVPVAPQIPLPVVSLSVDIERVLLPWLCRLGIIGEAQRDRELARIAAEAVGT